MVPVNDIIRSNKHSVTQQQTSNDRKKMRIATSKATKTEMARNITSERSTTTTFFWNMYVLFFLFLILILLLVC